MTHLPRKRSLYAATAVIGFVTMLCATPRLARADIFNDLASFQAATTGLQLINFDTDPSGAPTPSSGPIGATYSGIGVSFSPGNDFESGFTGPVSPPNGWINNTFIGSAATFDADIIISGVTAIGVHNVLFGGIPDGSILTAFDAASNVLETVTSDNDGNTLDFFGVTTTTDIARITISVPNASGWGLDDLWFGAAAAVPEPTSIGMLLGCGVPLIAFAFRRRRR